LGGGLSVQVLGTPGHPRDFLSYYIPEKKILISSEAVGCHTGYKDCIVSEFIYSYRDYVKSMKRLATLDVEILCQGHQRVFVGDDVRVFLKKSLKAAQTFKEQVLEWLEEEKGDVDQVVLRVKDFEYDHRPNPKQPEPAYLLNTRARVQHLKEVFDSE
jgi:glyoxylase-like metal-dependent hydrolase (beta-lactamase superfamily II)